MRFILFTALVVPFALGQGRFGFGGPWFQLSFRLERLGLNLDADDNGVITNEEVIADLERNFDANNDSCVTKDEWESRWIGMGFTDGFAQHFFDVTNQQPGNNSECEGVSIDRLKNTPDAPAEPVDVYVDSILQNIINMCEGQLLLYTTNLDCSSLPYACRSTPLACSGTCQGYMFITTEGRGLPFGPVAGGSFGSFTRELREYVQAVDADNDGVLTGEEIRRDYETNFDSNNDSCVDQMEFKARMILRPCGGLSFTEDFTDRRFAALRSGVPSSTCDGIDINAIPAGTQQSVSDFESENLRTLIDFCEENPRRYTSDSDCGSLPRACRSNDLSTLPVCQQYQETIRDRRGPPFQDAQQILGQLFNNFRNGSVQGDVIEL